MSGHSKWATIKRQKGANDAKRGAVFTKLSNAITIAVRQGGGIGDPNQNFRLRLAVEMARTANMPKDNIERAIQRAAGKQADSMEEIVYEGFGPGGISIMVEAVTDNKNRTTSEVQSIFNKNGGNMGQPGSVGYQFQQLGRIIVEMGNKSVDDIFLESADAGVQDFEEGEDEIYLYTNPGDLAKVRTELIGRGYALKEVDLIRKPLTPMVITDTELADRIMIFLEKLEDNDDVQKVYTNFELA